jgi:hypothetical protein
MTCQEELRLAGEPYPRTCAECGLGPCREKQVDLIERVRVAVGFVREAIIVEVIP